MEKLVLTDRASGLFHELPQPLYMGFGAQYLLENVSCPVKSHDILLGRFEEHLLSEEEEIELSNIAKRAESVHWFQADGGHCCFDWKELLTIGISGYVNKARESRRKWAPEDTTGDRSITLQGMEMVYRAYRRYMERYGEAAEEAGLHDAAEVCRNLVKNPPATFREAIQLILFVQGIFSIYFACNATLCCGRMDELLAPYYERDIAAGILTREDAGYMIDDFNCKSAIILGRGEHQMSGHAETDTGWFRNPMYDSPTYVILGGYSNTRDHRTNPLTKLFLERIHPRLENPVYVLRRTADIPEDVWTLACDRLRQNSTLLIYNDETVIPAFLHSGVDPVDAREYTIHGCNWPDIYSLNQNHTIGSSIPAQMMKCLFDDDLKFRKSFRNIDEIYEEFKASWHKLVHDPIEQNRETREKALYVPEMWFNNRDCFSTGPVEYGVSQYRCCKYVLHYTLLWSIGTAADIMTALDILLFGDNPVEPEVLEKALAADFVGYEDLLKRCKNLPKYGQDNDIADGHAVRLMSMLQDVMDEESINPRTGEKDITIANVTITDMRHIDFGRSCPATPDGRRAHAPFSENLSPTAGVNTSITALLNSVSKLPFDRIASGAFNVRMPKNLVSGEDGLANIKTLFETYFENGGMQLQISVADTAELRDAQKHPENYKDLMVRITGYSAVFVDMCESAQNEVIRRDEVS